MDVVKIHESGPLTTVQDKGRKGYQKFGMPVAGAMDLFSYRIANLLVGNDDGAAAMEFTLQGPKMEFLEETVIAITGAEAVPFLNNKPVPLWQSIFVAKGSILSFQGIKSGLRGYIAISGGINVPQILGSSSTYLRGNIGGFSGRKLEAGDIIKVNNSPLENCTDYKRLRLPEDLIPVIKQNETIRVILGPQDELFKKESIDTFLASDYEISAESDRMGYRLSGPIIEHKESADIISDGIPPGAIQVPGHGQPIIMLSDRQTTGGYAKIATVISTDLNTLAQLTPGSKIRFKPVTLEEAHNTLRVQEDIMGKIEEFDINIGPAKVYRVRVSGQEFTVRVEEVL